TNTAAKLTITPAPAIITLTNLNLTYDGTPKFATAIADPVAAGTNVKYFQGGNEVAVPIAAGSYAIEVVLINKNYAAEPVSSTLMINKAPTRTMVSVISTIYDGKPNGGTASVTGDGGLNQTLAVSYTGTTKAGAPYKGNEAPTEAGDYAAVASYAESDNYLGSFDSQLFSITQALGTITVTDLEKVYNGTAQRPTVITTPADLSVSVTYNGSSSVPIHAGFYAVEAVLNNSNYKAAIGAGALTIAKKPLTVTAADKIKVYGGPMPVLSGTLSGNVAGDEITVSYSTTAIQNSDVVPGGYPITATLFDPNKRLANYSVTNTPGVLIITPAPATISVTGLSKTYNGQPQAAMVTSLPEGLTVNVTYEGSVTVPTDAGSYAVVAALNNANYSATNGTGTLVIDKADQEIVWETPDPITYGAALGSIQMNARVIGIEGGSPPGALSYTPDAGMILNAGSYVLNVAAAATDNYKAATKTVTLVVNKANQAIDFSPLDDKTYGDPSFNVSAVTSSGRAVSFSIVSGPATINGNTIAITGAGDVVVRASQTGDGNYNPAADVDRTFTVQKATATVTLGSLTQTYDGSVKEVVFTLYPSGLSGVKIIYQQEGVPVTAPISAGTYQVTATLDHINYLATPATSTLEIYKAATVTTITVSDEVYTGNPHGGTAAVIGAADLNQTLSISYTGTTMAGVLYSSNEPPTEAGEYIASASYAESNNYLGSSSSKAFVINKAVSTVSVKYESALFNGSPHSATAIVRGVDDVISDAVVTYVYVGTPNGAPEYSYNSTDAPTLAGRYTVNARFEGNYNYNGDDATATIRIYAIPTVSLSSPSPVAINNISSIKATLGDDVHNVKWFFTSDPSITTGNTQNSQELNIKSSAPNVYSVYVTFEDGLGKSGYVSANVYAVFFDPAAGFVTGGGWISSPEGAYTPNTTLAGKANFGFVSKFEKGKTIPTGNTEFQFQAGGMNFKSNEYEYLVVAGARAQFKGKGTINGIGNFGFMLSAVDENLLGSVSPDKFRIKIWDNNDGGKVVYDNQIGATEDVLPTTVIGGGSIVIHTPGGGSKKANAIAADAYEHELTGPAKFILKAFPNPSVSKFSLRLESDHAEDKIILRIVDLNGRTIEVINNASPGQTYSIGASYRPGVYLVEMIQGSRRSQAMLLKVAD
ncbi:MAG TPA: MBG domain-containing protein, partial [Chitinophagaceae bacterium]